MNAHVKTGFNFDLVSPEKMVLSRSAHMVMMPGQDGFFVVARDHSPLVAALKPGLVRLYESEDTIAERFLITGGFVEVTNERCTLLAEEAVNTHDTSLSELRKDISRYQNLLEEEENSVRQQQYQEKLEVAEALLKAYQLMPDHLQRETRSNSGGSKKAA